MATTVTDFGVSKEKTQFSGSSEEDIVHAKMFWQSMQLLPPMESRLVSQDIKQRLKVAPPAHQTINLYHKKEEDSPELTSFLAKAQAMQKQEELLRLEKFSALRDADIAMLHKHREERFQKEKISAHRGLRSKQPDAVDQAMRESEEETEAALTAEETSQEIARFEQSKGLSDAHTHGDSDSD